MLNCKTAIEQRANVTMDAIAKHDLCLTKGNKENTKPAVESKPFSRREVYKPIVGSSVNLHSNNKKAKEVVNSSNTKSELNDVNAVKKNKKNEHGKPPRGASERDSKKRQTLSQVFLTEQAARPRKRIAEAPKPPSTVLSKPALGTYKGRIVESKIGCLWKSGSHVEGMEQKGRTTSKPLDVERQKIRSKSVANLQGRDIQRQRIQPARSKSVSDRLPNISNHRATAHSIVSHSADTARNMAPALPSSRKSSVICKVKETENLKNKMPVTTDKVLKRPVTSSLTQYRISTEAAEERRAKLADWLASKGKTLKRPPVSLAPPKKNKAVSKPAAQLNDPTVEALPATKLEHNLQSELQSVQESCTEDNPGLDQQASSHLILNSTLDLLDNSNMDLPIDPEIKMNDVVVNLCDALEAMTTLSDCDQDESLPLKLKDESSPLTSFVPKKSKREDDIELAEDGFKCPDKVEVKSDSEESFEEEDIDLRKTPELEEASVVKYNVKTTPYLQSVKRTIEGETNTGGSRQKSTIKDLKFLTPVRRSTRIQRQSSRMPEMLADHDPCVSSLAELVKLDEDSNAYIYRRNPVLFGDLPDHPRDLERI